MLWTRTMGLRVWVLMASSWVPISSTILSTEDAERPISLSPSMDGQEAEHRVTYDMSHLTASTNTFITDALREWHLPGISIAVVNHSATFVKGFGHSLLPDVPMTPDTLFYCGSTTKSFTAAAMSLIVDDENDWPDIGWSTPMSQLLRDDFVLSDEWATAHITIEDALSHRTGYPGHTLGINNTSPREAVRRLRHLPMSAEPRTTYQYSNYMFTAVGHLIEILTGEWLGDFFRQRLWHPMGMYHTYLTREDAEAGGLSLAAEYRWHNDTDSFVQIPHLPNGRGREAAGMVISNVVDYARYLRVMMAKKKPLSIGGHEAIRTPRTIMGDFGKQYTGPIHYGFGWTSGVIAGEQFWFHNGQIREHVSQMWMFPARDFALVTLANADSPAPDIIAWRIIYDMLKVEENKRWNAGKSFREREERREIALETCVSRLYPDASNPPLPRPVVLPKMTGIFHDAGYGNITIHLDCSANGSLPKLTTPMHLERENGCYLRTTSAMGLEGRAFHIVFEHVTGDFWVGWVIIDEDPVMGKLDQQRPAHCLRAEFQLNASGNIQHVGLDMRQEDERGPLVWFRKID